MKGRNLEIDDTTAWDYMKMVARDKDSTIHHELYVPVPRKIQRCINLSY